MIPTSFLPHGLHRFQGLPVSVRVLVTSRPQTLVALDAWKPTWIQPTEERNLMDLRTILRTRLEGRGHVAADVMDAAVELVVSKSQVRPRELYGCGRFSTHQQAWAGVCQC